MSDKNEDYFVKRAVPQKVTEERIAPQKKPSGTPEQKKKENGGAVEAVKKQPVAMTKRVVKALTFDYFGKPSSIDTVFLLLLIMIIGVGTVMSFSASYAYAEKKYDNSYYFLIEHLSNLFFAVALFIIFVFMPPEIYKGFTYVITVASIVLLVLVLFIGVVRNGAKRWIDLPGLPMFQPSEVAKLALVMLLALYFDKHRKKVESEKIGTSFMYGLVFPGMMLCVFLALLYFEHHFSAIIIFCCITFSMMVIGRSWYGWWIMLAVCAVAGIGLLMQFSDYAMARLNVWLDPWVDPSGDGWQTIQGLYAIASGGIFGVGLGNSIQKYGYVSEPQNDFIFTIVCEELGFVGAFAVIVLFVALIMRGFYIAKRASNRYSYYLVMGIMIKLALQVAFNIAVVTKTFPNTGISLPFFSSGGTQLVLQMIEMGIVLSVSRYSHLKK